MGDTIIVPKGPRIEVVDQRVGRITTRVWNALPELRDAAQTLPTRQGRTTDMLVTRDRVRSAPSSVQQKSAKKAGAR